MYKLAQTDLFSDMDLGLAMFLKGKLPLLPHGVKNKKAIKAAFKSRKSAPEGQAVRKDYGYFPGCSLRGTAAEFADSLEAVMKHLGYDAQGASRLELLRRDERPRNRARRPRSTSICEISASPPDEAKARPRPLRVVLPQPPRGAPRRRKGRRRISYTRRFPLAGRAASPPSRSSIRSRSSRRGKRSPK